MPRGSSPKSRENLKKAYSGRGGFDTETARKANKKSGEAKAAIKPLRELLKEQCSEDDRRQMNENLIRMAKHNIRAYELLMKALGEDPGQKVEVSGAGGGPLNIRWMNSPDEKVENNA